MFDGIAVRNGEIVHDSAEEVEQRGRNGQVGAHRMMHDENGRLDVHHVVTLCPRERGALWSITAKNTDCSTGPLARPFARSLAPLTRGTVINQMAILSVLFWAAALEGTGGDASLVQ